MRQLLAVLACAVAPSLAGAQFPDRVQPGARVRLWIPEAYNQENGPWRRQLLRGTVAGAIAAALENDPRSTEWPHYNRTWRAAEEGAKGGAVIGAVVGFVLPTERWKRLRLR